METKTFYLGVDSTETALKVIDSLSFFKVVNMKTAQVKYNHEDRMSLGIHSINEPKGAIIFITGAFTHKESAEIEDLAEYSYALMMEPAVNLMNKTKSNLEKHNIHSPHVILGEQKNDKNIDVAMPGKSIITVTNLKIVQGKTMTKIKQTFKSPHIHGSLAAGFSIIALAVFSKYICKTPIGYLSLAIPPFIATIHSSLVDKYKERRFMRTWYWIAAILLSTAVVILIHL